MNLLSLNIRGIGDRQKQDWVRSLRRAHRISVACLQETQLGASSSSRIDIRNCWGNNQFDFEIMEATGRSGGLLTIWDDSLLRVSDCIRSRYFLIIFGTCNGIGGELAIANIYAPHSLTEKRKLWFDLSMIKASRGDMWLFGGDFNVVRRIEERRNSRFCQASASDFNQFIFGNSLQDLRMGGFNFTFFRQVDLKLAKLDRFLVDDGFLAAFPGSSVTALDRNISDHCPIILCTQKLDFGPKPFKLFNSWMLCEGFSDVVHKAWSEFQGFGAADSFLGAKLRFLKVAIKKWRDLEHLKENGELLQLQKKVSNIDKEAENRTLMPHEIGERLNCVQRLMELGKLKTLDLKQRAKVKWLVDGDENSRFFHGHVNNRTIKNHMHGLTIGGIWNSNPAEMKHDNS